jgi:hypothetical protein
MNELRRAALALAAKDKPVFPCRPNGKEPLTINGFKDASVDRAVVLHWWGRWPDANIGLANLVCGLAGDEVGEPQGAEASSLT